jgi:hypothetical protein
VAGSVRLSSAATTSFNSCCKARASASPRWSAVRSRSPLMVAVQPVLYAAGRYGAHRLHWHRVGMGAIVSFSTSRFTQLYIWQTQNCLLCAAQTEQQIDAYLVSSWAMLSIS